jgi:segregation and condensation protein B
VEGHGVELVEIGGGWQILTRAEYTEAIERAQLAARPARLSGAALETLAIIAYRQPITRAEVEQIRGVNVDGTMQTLTERGLVESVGRAEVVGRPMTYGTTSLFLEYFGLGALDDLPAADELRKIVIEKPPAPLTADPGLATMPPEQLALQNPQGENQNAEQARE